MSQLPVPVNYSRPPPGPTGRPSGLPRPSKLPTPSSVARPAYSYTLLPAEPAPAPGLSVPRIRPRILSSSVSAANLNSRAGKTLQPRLSRPNLASSVAAPIRPIRPPRTESPSPPPDLTPTVQSTPKPRGPRPSLSDRTVETLLRLPSSPGSAANNGRRASSFFTSIDSINDSSRSRPGSRLDAPYSANSALSPRPPPSRPTTPGNRYQSLRSKPSHNNFGASVASSGPSIPPLPTSRPASRPTKLSQPRFTAKRPAAPAARPAYLESHGRRATNDSPPLESPTGMVMVRNSSDGTPRQSRVTVRPRSPERAPSRSPVRRSPVHKAQPTTPRSSGSPIHRSGSPAVTLADFPTFKLQATPPRPVRTITARAPRSINGAAEKSSLSKSTISTTTPKGSDSLREQIRKARAAHKASGRLTAANGHRPQDAFDFDAIVDPFNQATVDPQASLLSKLSTARESGRLALAGYGLETVPDELLNMYEVDFAANKNVDWSSVVDLVRLDISDNDIRELPKGMFPDVAAPKVANNFWDAMTATNVDGSEEPYSSFHLLEAFNLSGNKLSSLPIGLRKLEHLTTLNLSLNNLSIESLSFLADLPAIRDLRISKNPLTGTLSTEICAITTLETLEARECQITDIPDAISQLYRLRTLDLTGNRISALPMGALAQLPSLNELVVAKNKLGGALFGSSNDVSETAFGSLTELDLSLNRLSSIFPHAGDNAADLPFRSLTKLSLTANALSELPSLRPCGRLATLLLSENSLSALPAGFTTLSNLRTANLANNNLRDIQPVDGTYRQFAEMDSLNLLDLSGNPLRDRRLVGVSIEKTRERLRAMAELAEEMDC